MSKKDMYTVWKTALEKTDTLTYEEQMKRFMENVRRKSGKNLTLCDVRRIADEVSYEFILDLLAATELFDSVNNESWNQKKAEDFIAAFLKARSIMKRRAML